MAGAIRIAVAEVVLQNSCAMASPLPEHGTHAECRPHHHQPLLPLLLHLLLHLLLPLRLHLRLAHLHPHLHLRLHLLLHLHLHRRLLLLLLQRSHVHSLRIMVGAQQRTCLDALPAMGTTLGATQQQVTMTGGIARQKITHAISQWSTMRRLTTSAPRMAMQRESIGVTSMEVAGDTVTAQWDIHLQRLHQPHHLHHRRQHLLQLQRRLDASFHLTTAATHIMAA